MGDHLARPRLARRPSSQAQPTFGTRQAVNAAGCALIGMLMVAFTEVWRPHRLALPFLGVAVLGGFTTFSVYVIDVQHALAAEPFAASAPGAGRRR